MPKAHELGLEVPGSTDELGACEGFVSKTFKTQRKLKEVRKFVERVVMTECETECEAEWRERERERERESIYCK